MSKLAFFDVHATDLERVTKTFPDAKVFEEPLSAETVTHARDAEIVSIFVTSTVDKAVLTQLPKLKHVACRSTGYDNIDLPTAHKQGVLVSNVPSYGENTVAEYAFTLLLALARKLRPALEQVESGLIDHATVVGGDLAGKTLGVIGTGRIGSHAITIGRGFGMKVVGFDPFPRLELEGQLGFHYLEFRELLKSADFISIHAPLTDTTKHLFDAKAFRAMKPTAILINTARGEIIDTSALVDALTKNQIAGAGLDVLEGEDLLDIHAELQFLSHHRGKKSLELAGDLAALQKLSNVIVSPHNAFNTSEAIDRIWATSRQNIQSYLDGEPINLVEA